MDWNEIGDESDEDLLKADISKIQEVLGKGLKANCEEENEESGEESCDYNDSDSDAPPQEEVSQGFSDAISRTSLDEEILLVDDNLPASDENCLQLNRLYQELLIENLNQLQQLLLDNREKQEELRDILQEKLKPGSLLSTLHVKKKNVFAYPYFKDIDGYNPPLNSDAIVKARSIERDPNIARPKNWSSTDDTALMDGIRVNAMQLATRPMTARMDEIKTSLESETMTREKRSNLQLLLEKKEESLEKIRKMSFADLIQLNQGKDFDWLMLSTLLFPGERSPAACELYWRNCLHPSINRGKWTEDEESRLKEIAKVHGERDWDKIAEELQSGRRAWQCLVKFQSYLGFMKKNFSREDDKKLLNLVRCFGTGTYVPWQQICYHMDNFSKKRIRNRWFHHLDPRIKHGKWSLEEDVDLVFAIWRFSTSCWQRCSFPGRTGPQCRARWLDVLNPELSLEPFSLAEDRKLEELVRQYSSAWAKIAREFKDRSPLMLKSRWISVLTWRNKLLEEGSLDFVEKFPPSRERCNKRAEHRTKVFRKLAARIKFEGGLQVPTGDLTTVKGWFEMTDELNEHFEAVEEPKPKIVRKRRRIPGKKRNNRKKEAIYDRKLSEIFWVCQYLGQYRNKFEFDPEEDPVAELHVEVLDAMKQMMCLPCGSQESVTGFLAPNVSTLTAFRNLLLVRGRLRGTAHNYDQHVEEDKSESDDGPSKRVKVGEDEVSELMPNEYHSLLVNFCAIFFWPAIFSSVAPNDDHLQPPKHVATREQNLKRRVTSYKVRKRAAKKPWVSERMTAKYKKMRAEAGRTQPQIPEQADRTDTIEATPGTSGIAKPTQKKVVRKPKVVNTDATPRRSTRTKKGAE